MSRDPEVLVRAAVAGTGQAGVASGWTGTPVDAFADGVEGPPEHRLLVAAGAWAVFRQAGTKLDDPVALPAEAPPETRPQCSPAAAELVRKLCHGGPKELLVLAGERLERAGLRLPAELLPLVLEEGDEKARRALRPALGERGRWLAGFRESWSWAAAAPASDDELPDGAEEVWEEGSAAERGRVLARVRRLDPSRARDWLREVWKAEKAEARARFLATFEEDLSAGDEEFLEEALGDRSVQVRETAAALLARLDGSAYSRRMAERALSLLSWEPPRERKGLLGRLAGGRDTGVLTADPPAELEGSWERDGIRLKVPAERSFGERSWWLYQVLVKVPPERFSERFAAEPAALITAAAAASDFADAVLDAWTDAAGRFRSRSWLGALWEHWVGRKPGEGFDKSRRLETLAAAMEAEKLAERLLPLLPKTVQGVDRGALLACLPGPWPRKLARAFLDGARRDAMKTHEAAPLWRHLAGHAVELPEGLLAEARARWPELDPTDWRRRECAQQIERFLEAIELRQTLIREVPL